MTANFEDYDRYEETSCNLKHWPDMWPEEMAAEGVLYRERMRMKDEIFFLARSRAARTIKHFKTVRFEREYMDKIKNKAIAYLAGEQGWQVKNEYAVMMFGVTPIYTTRDYEL